MIVFPRDAYVLKDKRRSFNIYSIVEIPQPLSRYITGCVVSVRVRGHKNRHFGYPKAQDSTIVREIGRRWKSMMNLPPNTRIQFETHNESGSAQQKPMYEE